MDRREIERQLTEPGTGVRLRRVRPARKHHGATDRHGATAPRDARAGRRPREELIRVASAALCP